MYCAVLDINRSTVEFKGSLFALSFRMIVILIEAQWNLKGDLNQIQWGAKVHINRSTVEFKERNNERIERAEKHINRSTVEFKEAKTLHL